MLPKLFPFAVDHALNLGLLACSSSDLPLDQSLCFRARPWPNPQDDGKTHRNEHDHRAGIIFVETKSRERGQSETREYQPAPPPLRLGRVTRLCLELDPAIVGAYAASDPPELSELACQSRYRQL